MLGALGEQGQASRRVAQSLFQHLVGAAAGQRTSHVDLSATHAVESGHRVGAVGGHGQASFDVAHDASQHFTAAFAGHTSSHCVEFDTQRPEEHRIGADMSHGHSLNDARQLESTRHCTWFVAHTRHSDGWLAHVRVAWQKYGFDALHRL